MERPWEGRVPVALELENHVWRWRERSEQEAQGRVLRALESHGEENQRGQPSGTLSWRRVYFLSWGEAVSPRRETLGESSPNGVAPEAVLTGKSHQVAL